MPSKRIGAAPTSSPSTTTRASCVRVETILQAMAEDGEAPATASAEVVVGDALSLPYADETFDCVIASEILEHVPQDDAAIAELIRVLKVGGDLAVSVPRWLPERVCWLLSDEYHSNEGGHVRIYRADELRAKIVKAGWPNGLDDIDTLASCACAALAVLVAEMRCGSFEARTIPWSPRITSCWCGT